MMAEGYRLIIRSQAETDLRDGALHYDLQQHGLGSAFLDEAWAAIVRAVQNPLQFPCLRRKPEIRRVLTNRFPYRVFLIRRQRYVIVFRVLHAARHDREWRSSALDEQGTF
jgi:plasmid stabilization system protein ParE